MPSQLWAIAAAITLSVSTLAQAEEAPPPATAALGHILVRDAVQGVIELPLDAFKPHGHYKVTIKLYRVADDPAVTYPLPLPADARAIGETGLTVVDGMTANSISAQQALAVRELGPGEQPPFPTVAGEPEVAVDYDTLLFIYAPGADQTARSTYGPQDGAQRRIMAAADHLAVGGFDIYLYAPAANRAEVFIERSDATPTLRYLPGEAMPELVAPQLEYRPYAWLVGQLRGTDQGWLFTDGAEAPVQEAVPTAAMLT
jgi:hypothetical protein